MHATLSGTIGKKTRAKKTPAKALTFDTEAIALRLRKKQKHCFLGLALIALGGFAVLISLNIYAFPYSRDRVALDMGAAHAILQTEERGVLVFMAEDDTARETWVFVKSLLFHRYRIHARRLHWAGAEICVRPKPCHVARQKWLGHVGVKSNRVVVNAPLFRVPCGWACFKAQIKRIANPPRRYPAGGLFFYSPKYN